MSDSRGARRLEVKTVVDLPGPRFRGLRQGGVHYAAVLDVVRFLRDTALAFDRAHALCDLGLAFRAVAEEIENAELECASALLRATEEAPAVEERGAA